MCCVLLVVLYSICRFGELGGRMYGVMVVLIVLFMLIIVMVGRFELFMLSGVLSFYRLSCWECLLRCVCLLMSSLKCWLLVLCVIIVVLSGISLFFMKCVMRFWIIWCLSLSLKFMWVGVYRRGRSCVVSWCLCVLLCGCVVF